HGPPQVVAWAHLLDQLALPRVLNVNACLGARAAGDVGALRELVAPDAVLTDEHDSGTAPADILDDCLRTAVVTGQRLDAVDQPAGHGAVQGHGRIGTICHDGNDRGT